MTELACWESLRRVLRTGRPCALLVVAAGRGSAPGKPGAMLALSRDGALAGTIGGGRVEAELVALALARLQADSPQAFCMTRVHRPHTNQGSGMICGGEQTVVFAPLLPSDLPLLDALIGVLRLGREFRWSLSPAGWRADTGEPGLRIHGDNWRYGHCSGRQVTVCLIGGGHVSLALSRLLVRLDFRVVVLEERPGVATFKRNRFAHERRVGDYADVCAALPEGDRVYAVIMTHAHERDAAAWRALAEKPLGYLGVLGSHAKLRALIGPGPFPAHVHAPAGVAIHSHSPDEIAVSIAAEMIARRAQTAAHAPQSLS